MAMGLGFKQFLRELRVGCFSASILIPHQLLVGREGWVGRVKRKHHKNPKPFEKPNRAFSSIRNDDLGDRQRFPAGCSPAS
jgi:hypothetical protein